MLRSCEHRQGREVREVYARAGHDEGPQGRLARTVARELENRLGGYNGFIRFIYTAMPNAKVMAEIEDPNAASTDKAAFDNIFVKVISDELAAAQL